MTKDIKLTKLNPVDTSDIQVTFFQGISRERQGHLEEKVLLIKFVGNYADGSLGKIDARFMVAQGNFAIELYSPNGVIIDFSELSYQWGDEFDGVVFIGEKTTQNRAVIVGDKCAKAVGTLIHDDYYNDVKTPATEEEWIFDSFYEAWDYIAQKIEFDRIKTEKEIAKYGL